MTTQSILSYETCVHAIAGATGSIIAMSAFYPLDTVRFRQQLEDHSKARKSSFIAIYEILKNEGFNSLYQGIKPVLMSLGASNFIYFYTFHGLKSLQTRSAQSDLTLGVVAGVINVLITTPLWVVNSRLKNKETKEFSGLLDGLLYVANTEGLEALWSGVYPSLMLVLNPAIQFTIYETLKRKIPVQTATSFFFIGAVAKIVATVFTYPLQLVQTIQRNGKHTKMNTVSLLLILLKKGGPVALYQGLEAKLFQTVLTAALMFMTYEKIVQYVFKILLSSKKN